MRYIHSDNQNILWEKITKTSVFINWNSSPEEKRKWFRDIIGSFYDKNKFMVMGNKELREINKQTILYMINNINEINKMTYGNPWKDSENYDILRGFEKRSQEYEKLSSPEIPKILQNDYEKDNPIQNLDEIVKKFQEERNADLGFINNIEDTNQSKNFSNERLKKLTSINQLMDVVENEDTNIHISWNEPLEENTFMDESPKVLIKEKNPHENIEEKSKIITLEENITTMKIEINHLYEIIDQLSLEIREIKNTIPPFFQMNA
jgi:hypothetical protein